MAGPRAASEGSTICARWRGDGALRASQEGPAGAAHGGDHRAARYPAKTGDRSGDRLLERQRGGTAEQARGGRASQGGNLRPSQGQKGVLSARQEGGRLRQEDGEDGRFPSALVAGLDRGSRRRQSCRRTSSLVLLGGRGFCRDLCRSADGDAVLGWDGKAKARLAVADEQLDYGYSVALPDAAADAALKGAPHDTAFVDYLRLAFRWGGFPGWAQGKDPPQKELAFLTDGLLPI